MKVTIAQLLNSVPAIENLRRQPLPATTRHRLKGIIARAGQEIDSYNESRIELCEKYGTKPKDGLRYDIRPEEQAAFNAELNGLLNMELEIQGDKFKFQETSSAMISEIDGERLEWLLSEPDENILS